MPSLATSRSVSSSMHLSPSGLTPARCCWDEAAIFRIAPRSIVIGGYPLAALDRPDEREVLVLIVPFACYLFLGCVVALVTARVLGRQAPGMSEGSRALAGAAVGLALLLDPEAQHFATSGFTELPFTVLLPYANLFWTGVLSVPIGLILASAFPAIVVYGQELVPLRVGTVAGLFFGFAFGLGGIGAALLGQLADVTGVQYVFKLCSFLPVIGLLAAFLPARAGVGRPTTGLSAPAAS